MFEVDLFNFSNYYNHSFYINHKHSINNVKYNQKISAEKSNLLDVKIIKMQFKRLPPPYDTNCEEYGYGTRDQCISDCLFSYYYDKYGCIPLYNSSLNLLMKNNYLNTFKFCQFNESKQIAFQSKYMKLYCEKTCLIACNQEYYFIEKIEIDDLSEDVRICLQFLFTYFEI